MSTSRWLDLDGRVHFVEHEGPDGPPPFVLVHGLGGSHRNWMRLAPLLAEHARTYAIDMRGFGFTPLGPHRSTIAHNVALVTRFIEQVAGARAVIAGNSTGGVVSVFLAAARPDLAEGMILVDAALPGVAVRVEPLVLAAFSAMMVPGLGERVSAARVRRLGLDGVQRETLKLVTADVERVPADVLEAHLEMARLRGDMPWALPAFHQLTRSLIPTLLRGPRYRRMARAVRALTLVVHGVRDRLVPIAAARAITAHRPDWRLVQLPDLGHAPMLEDPGAVADAILPWARRLAEHARAR